MAVDGIFSVLRSTLNGMSFQMRKMNAISENIANAERSPDADNQSYRKQVVVKTGSASGRPASFADHFKIRMRGSQAGHLGGNSAVRSEGSRRQMAEPGFEVVQVDDTKMVYNPTHPQADDNGYVKMPNINVVEEMIDLVSASRAYEANISVMNAAKQMAKRVLSI